MRQPAFVPDAGDVVWLEFDPQAGYEQAAHRPAVVLHPATCNGRTGLMISCRLTTRIKGVSVRNPSGQPIRQRSALWRRRATHKGKVSDAELRQVRGKPALIG